MSTINKLMHCSLLIGLLITGGCKKNWLERSPQTILTDEQIWNDPKLVVSVLANLYDRLPAHYSLTGGWQLMSEYDDAMWSGFGNDEGRNNIPTYNISRWRLWEYTLIRDINLAIDNLAKPTKLTEGEKKQFTAELRFLRAYLYFEMVKRMGGVPLVTKQLIYNFDGNPTPLQQPRNKEAEVYDFIGSEVDAIKNDIGNGVSKTRANKYTALALKCRAMLYAGSLAKYNNLMPAPITTPGGEVGIPASMANDYYTKALAAAQEIITDNKYSLYNSNPNKGENFYEAITNKSGNPEVIWAQDFAKGKTHFFTYDNIPRSAREDNLSPGCITPSLNLVESYEYLDGTPGVLKHRTADNSDFIYYDRPQDIFANKDGRLYGTVIYPGTSFRGVPISIQAGVMVWNAGNYQTIEGALGSNHSDGKLLTGLDGPRRAELETTNTGFYLRKYVDSKGGAGQRSQLSDMWWIRFRFSEVLLNAAEAALELNDEPTALDYVNKVRFRAGFPANSLANLTLEKLQQERRNELAFEDHRVWDLKRWRIADKVWDGQPSSPETMVYALYPYRIIRPGDAARDGKYVFVKMVAPRYRAAHWFQMPNYYSSIDQAVLNNNPKIVRNPFH